MVPIPNPHRNMNDMIYESSAKIAIKSPRAMNNNGSGAISKSDRISAQW
jgi:hypothetical protein